MNERPKRRRPEVIEGRESRRAAPCKRGGETRDEGDSTAVDGRGLDEEIEIKKEDQL